MRNLLKILIIIILFSSIAGCTQIRRKFTRKKKPKKITPIVEIKDYSTSLKVDELYKKHFVFWKYWEEELIHNLGKNIKKQKRCYIEALSELKTMASYLQEQKQKLLQPYIDKLEELKERIEKPVLSQIEIQDLRLRLKRHKRIVDREFSLSKVESWLIEQPR